MDDLIVAVDLERDEEVTLVPAPNQVDDHVPLTKAVQVLAERAADPQRHLQPRVDGAVVPVVGKPEESQRGGERQQRRVPGTDTKRLAHVLVLGWCRVRRGE